MSYPTIHNGDHAEFETEWAGKDPKTRPDWPLPSFDARDWAEAFCKWFPTVEQGTAESWFANALMRGYDEGRKSQWAAQLVTETVTEPEVGPPPGWTPDNSWR